jgi:hypothetical protein
MGQIVFSFDDFLLEIVSREHDVLLFLWDLWCQVLSSQLKVPLVAYIASGRNPFRPHNHG